jgi:2-oxoglutarate ferredoxin oxidoreductase subunit alpha
MPRELTLKICGEAKQGLQTIGIALCQMFKKAGCGIFANQDYMSRIRGGNNFFQIRISDRQVYTLCQKSDITVALDKKSVALHKTDLNAGGFIVLDRKKFDIPDETNIFFDVPFYELTVMILLRLVPYKQAVNSILPRHCDRASYPIKVL